MSTTDANTLREIAPTGTLRVAIAVGPPGSPMWVTTLPAGSSTIRARSLTRRSSLSSNPLKSGTRCRCRMRASHSPSARAAGSRASAPSCWGGSEGDGGGAWQDLGACEARAR